MKKLLSFLLCLCLLTAMLTACGNDTKKQEDKEKDEKPRPSISDKVPEDDTACVTIDAYGNVEMALNLPKITWGNQIALSNRLYGLDKITLYPARLNSDSGALVNRTSPLQYPKYGADGRVAELDANTLVGAYDSKAGGFIYTPGNESVGVSGVGKTASMSKRAFAIMNGKSAIASGKSAAANAAKDAIRQYGGELAALVIDYQNADDDATVVNSDIANLKSLIAKLTESHTALSEALKSAVQVVLAADPSLSDGQWAIAADLANGKDIIEYLSALAVDYSSVSYPSELTTMIAQYEAIGTKLVAVSADLPASGDCTWGDIEDSVTALLKASGIRIGGYTISEVKQAYSADGMGSDVVRDLFNKVSDGSLSYTFTAASGIFADIAVLTGSYISSMAFPEGTEVEGLDLNMLGAKPTAVDASSTGDIDSLSASDTIVNAQAPGSDSNAKISLTDTYGYVVDLLFRTNATESDLLLQTAPANRYAEGAVDETEGNGSNMTFTINDEYSVERIEGVAAGIRVVFFDQNGAILAVGTLDTISASITEDTYNMNLVLSEYTIENEGVLSITGPQSDNKICPLTANVTAAISALVYLDGDVIDNAHVGMLTGLEAMLNLQFASSVELKSAGDADLMGE